MTRVQGTSVGGGGGTATTIKQVEVNFGDVSFVVDQTFDVVDTSAVSGSLTIATLSTDTASTQLSGDSLVDEIEVFSAAESGVVHITLRGLSGSLYGAYKVNYQIK